MAVYGYNAKRITSAISFGTVVALAVGVALHTWAGVYSTLAAVPPFVVAFVVGLFLSRLAVAVSASVAMVYAVNRLVGLPADFGYLVAASLASAALLYALSKRVGYAPYTILGSSGLVYFASHTTHAAVAATLGVLVGVAGYVVQERSRRIKDKHEKIRLSIRKLRRSHRHTKSPYRLRGSTPEPTIPADTRDRP